MNRKQIRQTIDAAMTVMLPLLMAYSLIGEALHEVIGSMMLVLFIVHHVLNRKWYAALGKGSYSARRIITTALDAALLIIMIMQPVSGILMSKHLYTFIRIAGVSASAREIHLCVAYWGLVLLCVHAGMHLAVPVNRFLGSSKTRRVSAGLIAGAISLYGLYAFIKRELPAYMFRKTLFAFFDFSEPLALFFMDYLAIMILFGAAGYILAERTKPKYLVN